jgi:hypothetical protein
MERSCSYFFLLFIDGLLLLLLLKCGLELADAPPFDEDRRLLLLLLVGKERVEAEEDTAEDVEAFVAWPLLLLALFEW